MQEIVQTTVTPPSVHNWRTTDDDEINRRRQRARTESFIIQNSNPAHPIFSNFRVKTAGGSTYSVEVRDVRQRQFACECVDFRINGLGTCKHVEAVLIHLEGRFKRLFRAAAGKGSGRLDVLPDPAHDSLRLSHGRQPAPPPLRHWFDRDGRLMAGTPETAVEELKRLAAAETPELRVSQELEPWLETRRRAAERKQLRHEYETKVQSGEWPAQETKVPLFPYQREGMLHLAFAERALLADEMGLGKTIQAIAACALLRRLGKAARVLIVTPASLKAEWEEQIQRFTSLPHQLIRGGRAARLAAYGNAPFFTIVNYEQMRTDAPEVNAHLRADVVVLDEAQRIKNWSAQTTQAIKRLLSRYAFILTGTPIENRLDELYSLMDFLDPALLGPLFRFNREYYELDDHGRPAAYRNLQKLHERIKPLMLRRRKADVETELPERTERNFLVPLSAEQQTAYGTHESAVARLAHLAKRRPLSRQEQDKLLRHLNMMRMVCDTDHILHPKHRACPKLKELEKILEECRDNADVKLIVFSEWEGMLRLARDVCRRLELGFAWHTGTVPPKRRRAEINAFKDDPVCRVFLSTDCGAAGLNLQNASVVINCDLPWNPAKLEQRIARAWRKNQTRPVTVINLISENSIEHRILATLSQKRALSDGVLDLEGDLADIPLRGGRQAFLARLDQLMPPPSPAAPPPSLAELKTASPADRPLGFAQAVRQRLNGALLRCEELYPQAAPHSVLYVVLESNSAPGHEHLHALHREFFGADPSGPLEPVRLEVVDRATNEALQRLMAAGLMSRTTRATRSLWPAEGAVAPPPLSEAEREKAAAFRAQAARKLKAADVLSHGDLELEARQALMDAIEPLGCALAVEHRLPEPQSLEDALLPPLEAAWKDALPLVRNVLREPAQPLPPLLSALGRV